LFFVLPTTPAMKTLVAEFCAAYPLFSAAQEHFVSAALAQLLLPFNLLTVLDCTLDSQC
jgi:hypothetical protein